MGQARVNRRRRRQMAMNNAQWTGMGVPRYGRQQDRDAKARRAARRAAERKAKGSQL